MSIHHRTVALLAVLVLACGDGPSDTEDGTALPGAEGGEAEAVAVVPAPDLVSLVPANAGFAVSVRFDLVRGSPLAPLALEMIQGTDKLRGLLEAGIDPLRDVDRLVAAGRENDPDVGVVAIEHRLTEAQLVQTYLHLAEAPPGAAPAFVQRGPYRVASVPGVRETLVLFTPMVAAVVPGSDLEDLLRRAASPGSDAGPVAQRLRQLEARAPDIAPAAALSVSAEQPESGGWSGETGQIGLPAPRWVAGTIAVPGGATAFVHAGYASPESAQTAVQSLQAIARQTLHPASLMIRVMGLGRALESSQVVAEGDEVSVRVQLQPHEVDLLSQRLRDGGP